MFRRLCSRAPRMRMASAGRAQVADATWERRVHRVLETFAPQLLDAVPVEPHDVTVDCVVTEDGPRWA